MNDGINEVAHWMKLILANNPFIQMVIYLLVNRLPKAKPGSKVVNTIVIASD